MCILASPVKSVANTRIFVGYDDSRTRQLTVYSMSVQLQQRTGKGNAMILPVPTGLLAATSIQPVDLSDTPDFFQPFVERFQVRSRSLSLSTGLDRDSLAVIRVGNYDVSIVPTVDDVKRLNPDVFAVSAETERTLRKNYPNRCAFLVAQLRVSGDFHPLGYTHPLVGGHLFVPTRHEHGNTSATATADWDHEIFYLTARDPVTMPLAERNYAYRKTLDASAARHVLQEVADQLPTDSPVRPFLSQGAPLSRLKGRGPLANIDLTIPLV